MPAWQASREERDRLTDQTPNGQGLALCWVGAHLTVGPPPGTVRAPLDAYGSTLETTERHIFQRGQLPGFPEPST